MQKQEQTILNWINEEFSKKILFGRAYEIILLYLSEYIESQNILINDNSYIHSEIINFLYKYCTDQNLIFLKQLKFIKFRLCKNIIKNKKGYYRHNLFCSYNEEILTRPCQYIEPLQRKDLSLAIKKKTIRRESILRRKKILSKGCIKLKNFKSRGIFDDVE